MECASIRRPSRASTRIIFLLLLLIIIIIISIILPILPRNHAVVEPGPAVRTVRSIAAAGRNTGQELRRPRRSGVRRRQRKLDDEPNGDWPAWGCRFGAAMLFRFLFHTTRCGYPCWRCCWCSLWQRSEYRCRWWNRYGTQQ